MKDLGLTSDILLQAYASGVFPMAEDREADEVFWVNPVNRGILPLDGFHISRSLARQMRRGGYEVALNRDFAGVVAACADRDETWINATIHDLYLDLHQQGHAQSLEIYRGGALIGGVYGVTLGAAFFGESMFSRARDGSKIALAHLVDHLRHTGFRLFDTQFITQHLASLGAVEISRAAYHRKLQRALSEKADFRASVPLATPQAVIQRNTQTS